MSRLFDRTLSQALAVVIGAIAEPFTLAAWAYTSDTTNYLTVLSVGDADDTDYHVLRLAGGEVGDPVQALSYDGVGSNSANSTAPYPANTWHHVAGVWEASNSRHVYLDGGNEDTSVGNRVIVGADRAAVGVTADSTPFGYMDGRVAEAAIWTVALAKIEIQQLAAGYCPLFVRPQSLLAYWPLIRDEDQDKVGDFDLTAINAPTVATHAPVIYPAPFPLPPIAVPPVGWHRHQSMTGVSARLA